MPIRSKLPHKHDNSDMYEDIVTLSDEEMEHDGRNITVHTYGWWSVFDKPSEVGSPGMYSILLDTPNVQADMLAISEMAGVHYYEWLNDVDGDGFPGFVFDACHGAKTYLPTNAACKNATLTIDFNANTISSNIHYAGRLSGGGIDMYLHAAMKSNTHSESVIGDGSVLICTSHKCTKENSIRVSAASATDGVYEWWCVVCCDSS